MKNSAGMENKKIKDRSILEQAVKTIAVPDDYCNCSIQLGKTAVRNQMHSGRCWIESALDELEYKYFRDTGKRLPHLSAGFIQYYDLCLKVHIFLRQIFQTKDLPLDDPQVNYWITRPVQDAGQRKIFLELLEKYGVVPEDSMESSVNFENTSIMIAGLNQKLRLCAYQIRNEKKEIGLLEREVVGLLKRCLGQIPERIIFKGVSMTPVEFYQKYIKKYVSDHEVSFINCPVKERPYNQNYKVKWLYADKEKGSPVTYYNIPFDVFVSMAIRQLEMGIPVWVGIDAEHFSEKEKGIFDTDMFDFETLFDTQLELEKGEAILYKDSSMTHALLLYGVDIEDGDVKRWCVKNSFGSKIGQDGYAYMSAKWFRRYVYQIVICKEVAKKFYDLENIKNAPTTWLQTWDGLGCLA